MKLATLRLDGRTVAVRIEDTVAVEIDGVPDVGALLTDPGWRSVAEAAKGAEHPLDDLAPDAWAPLVPRPGKIICVGLNYRNHIFEMGRELPEHPTLFSKYAESLIGAGDPLVLPAHAAESVDWEGELAFVMGAPARRVSEADAAATIAGFAILNDVSMRDYQNRTLQWLSGKSFEASTPFGPYLVTPDEFDPSAELRTEVSGHVMQRDRVDDLIFSPSRLVADISMMFPLAPGDVISTGTPGGVGHARNPPRYLRPGDVLETSIEGLGVQRNPVLAEAG